jgi:hypothetical protein
MFPVGTSGTSRPWIGDPFFWVGVARYHYTDGRVVEEVLQEKSCPDRPVLFQTAEAATEAAEAHARAFRLSEQSERLTGLYGGDS